jgi:hypothetical protein
MECDCAVLEWTREDQRAAFQGPPIALLCLRTESPLTCQQFHVMKLLIETALIPMDCTWKMSHDDVIQAAFHPLKTAHDGVRRHLCRKTNPHSSRKIKSNWSQDENLLERIYLQKFRQLMHGLYPLLQ